MEREGVSTLSLRSYLWALRGLLILKVLCALFLKMFYFVITLVSVLKSVDKENVFENCF